MTNFWTTEQMQKLVKEKYEQGFDDGKRKTLEEVKKAVDDWWESEDAGIEPLKQRLENLNHNLETDGGNR